MLSSYRQIFAAPGSLAFSSSGLIARLPISMTGIGIVTMLSQMKGTFWLGSALSATLAVSAAVLGPWISRLVDRHGQRRVALPATLVTVLAAAGLLLGARAGAPDWTLFVLAAGMGAMPSTGSMVRARWAHLYRDEPPKLHTAYSFEAVADEVCFIVGPILAVALATTVFPESGVLAAGLFLVVGILLFTAQRRTEPPVHPAARHAGGSVIGNRGLQILVLTLVATGGVFGSVEVVTVAFAKAQGHTGASGPVLAVYALGSCLAGAVFGTLKLTGSMARRFLIGVSVMAAGMVPLILAAKLLHGGAALVGAGVALFLSGLAISPTLITAMALVERLVPAAQLTEGMTWTTTGMALGVAVGSSAAGLVVDASGAANGYWVPVAAATAGALAGYLGLPRLRHQLAVAERTPAPEPVGS
ncbi:MFS transporter [Streptomyces sp. TLI_171]|uniref:MFS transporter n=1 Tax=Streptomyces sp. TLI_171 TaxID=1938859 RepID=UPI000C192251|nr:MFS transporter [Streptomyces sp. TLI_171]RKE21558.1 MFS transporter [Streptomyces sp. TLI_171]